MFALQDCLDRLIDPNLGLPSRNSLVSSPSSTTEDGLYSGFLSIQYEDHAEHARTPIRLVRHEWLSRYRKVDEMALTIKLLDIVKQGVLERRFILGLYRSQGYGWF